MKRIVLLLAVNLLVLSVFSQIQVYPLGNLPEKGVKYTGTVTYALPTTTFKVTVSVSKVQEVRGYFADYAESLLGLTNIIHQNRTYYTLNAVDVEPLKTADMKHCYCAFTSNAAIADSMFEANLSPNTAFPCGPLTAYQTHTATIPDFFKNYADASYTQQQETFVDTKIIDGVVTQVPANHTKTVSKSFESKAREAADAIMKSRKDQYNLAAGEQETPYSGEALSVMLSELKNWENNYMSLFTGVTTYDTTVYVFYVTPEESMEPTTAFYFDANKGFNQTKGTAAEEYKLTFYRFYPKISEIVSWNFPVSGYITRDSQPMRVALTHGNNVHDFGVIDMYQAGHEYMISPRRPMNPRQIGIIIKR